VLKGIQALNPSSENFADISKCVEKFAAAYAADVNDLGLQHELP